MLLREAIAKTKYNWKADGPTLPDAMLKILQKTGVAVRDEPSRRSYQRMDLKAALDHVFAVPAKKLSRKVASLVLLMQKLHEVKQEVSTLNKRLLKQGGLKI